MRLTRGWIAAAVTVACLGLLGARAELPAVERVVRSADYPLLGLALLLSAGTLLCKAARWRALYPAAERPEPGLATVAIAVGQVANWAIPLRAGEALRVGLVSGPRRGAASGVHQIALGVGVLAAEKLLDASLLLLAAGLLVALAGVPSWVRVTTLLALGAGIGCLTLAFVARGWLTTGATIPWLARILPARAKGILRHVDSAQAGLLAWTSSDKAGEVLLWSAASWATGYFTNVLALKSTGLDLGVAAALAVLVALYGGAIVPSLPGRLGVFQYLCVLALVPFGAPFDRALAFSLALYVAVYLPPILLGLSGVVLIRSQGESVARRLLGKVVD